MSCRGKVFPWLMMLATSVAWAQGSEDARTAEQEVRVEEIEAELRAEEERLAEAAARIAELSRRRLPAMVDVERRMRFGDRPMLGVTIGSEDADDGPVEGVVIRGVSPGGAAAEAGLRSGDVLTAINDENLSADTEEQANDKLLDFLEGVEEGDTLDIEYLRDGKAATAEVKPRPMSAFAFAFSPGYGSMAMRALPAPAAPGAPIAPMFNIFLGDGGWGDMEMVSLTGDLGRYFGTDKGLLVVRAPSDENLKLKDGDVIQRIDGREPTSVSHAMRILGSYQGGEKLELQIMRDRKRETLSIEIPDNRRSFVPAAPDVMVRPIDPEDTVILKRARRIARETT